MAVTAYLLATISFQTSQASSGRTLSSDRYCPAKVTPRASSPTALLRRARRSSLPQRSTMPATAASMACSSCGGKGALRMHCCNAADRLNRSSMLSMSALWMRRDISSRKPLYSIKA